MKIIKFRENVSLESANTSCLPGKEYIISDGYLSQITEMVGPGAIEGIYPFHEIAEKKYNGQDLTNKKILVWRTGGMGDLCFITPNLKYIKDKFPGAKIIFGCGQRFSYGMMNHPHIDELIQLPIDKKYMDEADYYLMFEGIIESNEEAHVKNAYDLFSERFGFTLKEEDKLPILGLTQKNLESAKLLFANNDPSIDSRKIVGLGLRASHIIRSIIPKNLHEIMSMLIQNDIRVALIGSKDDADIVNMLPLANHPLAIHCYKYSEDYRDAIAQISLLDGLIGPDSSPIHIAAAFKKPIVGVFGAFPSELRMKYYLNATGMDARLPCGPCFLHGIGTCEYSHPHSKEPMCMHIHKSEIIVKEMLMLMHYTTENKSTPKQSLLGQAQGDPIASWYTGMGCTPNGP
jgi:ADP-heptose:LPS heptosyltransferase